MTNSNKNILLENFPMEFVYNFVDKFENEIYVFKVYDELHLHKVKKLIKNMLKQELLTGFFYEKDGQVYIKVKKQNIKKINKLKFEKEQQYGTNLNLVYYDFKEKQGYYATIYDTKIIDAFNSSADENERLPIHEI